MLRFGHLYPLCTANAVRKEQGTTHATHIGAGSSSSSSAASSESEEMTMLFGRRMVLIGAGDAEDPSELVEPIDCKPR